MVRTPEWESASYGMLAMLAKCSTLSSFVHPMTGFRMVKSLKKIKGEEYFMKLRKHMKFKLCPKIHLYWNRATPICLRIAHGCFPSMELSSGGTDRVACKASGIWDTTLCKKALMTPASILMEDL